MNENPLPESASWGKQCDPTGICFNGPNTVWCTGSPDTGGCYGGGVGFFGIANKTRAEIHASTEKFYGPWVKDANKKIIGLKLISAGMLAAAGLQAGDVLTGIGKFLFSDPQQRETILNWNLTDTNLIIKFLRDDVPLKGEIVNPRFI